MQNHQVNRKGTGKSEILNERNDNVNIKDKIKKIENEHDEDVKEFTEALENSGIEEGKKKEILSLYAESYQGALPHLKQFKEFTELGDHVVDAILEMAKNNQISEMETRKSKNEFNYKQLVYIAKYNKGANFTFLILVLLILSGTLLIFFEKPLGGYGALVMGIIGVAKIFVFNNKDSDDEIDE